MITIKLPITYHSSEDADLIISIQRLQSSMIRSAYKAASFGLAEISVREELRNRFSSTQLDSWFQQSAVKSGIGMYKADVELGNSIRIFGGKHNFIRRSKGLISNEEWKECRLLPLYLIGESPAKGNRKFNFFNDHIVFKPWHGKKIELQLPTLRKNWAKLWSHAVLLAEQKCLPITVSLDSKFVYLTFDDEKVKHSLKSTPKSIKNRYAGIDMNPNYIGISIFDNDKLIDTKLFSLSNLTGKESDPDKLKYETIQIGHAIGKWLKHLRVDKLFIEELSFKQGSLGKGKNLNRLCKNQWKRTTLVSILKKYYPKLFEINAAYTSTIGNLLNPTLPDPIAASAAVAKRGFEVVIKKSKKFYPELPVKKELEDRWKETEFPDFKTWKELHDFIKNMGLKYRVPIPDREGFRIFQSRSSLIGVL